MEAATIGKFGKITLSDDQERWLVKHYKHTKNADICEKLGIGGSTLSRYARKLELKKSRQFMEATREAAAKASWISNLVNGTRPPKGFVIPGREKGQFKKGETNVGRLGAKKEAKRLAKSHVKRNETIRQERARLMFGIEQKTKMRLIKVPRAMTYQKCYLKKHGYIIDDTTKVAYYTPDTQRCPRMERKQRGKGVYYDFEPLAKEA